MNVEHRIARYDEDFPQGLPESSFYIEDFDELDELEIPEEPEDEDWHNVHNNVH
jgi:hypothetical protein